MYIFKNERNHRCLLSCRANGIDAAYTQLRDEIEAQDAIEQNPTLQAVLAFLETDDEVAAQAVARALEELGEGAGEGDLIRVALKKAAG